MMRLYIVVEGQTEEHFIRNVIAPHLWHFNVNASATIVGTPKRRGSAPLQKGGGDWSRWERDIRRVLGEQRGNDVRVSTFFDLYGLPEHFPGLREHGDELDSLKRAEALEAALVATFNDWRLIPYLQRHEFEALVLASLPSLRALLDAPEDLEGVDKLEGDVAGTPPEDVNDGSETAPSKRLLDHIPGYSKTLHGPLVTEETGLESLRSQCPRFGAWLTKLEELAQRTVAEP